MKNLKRKIAGFLIFAMILGIMTPGTAAQAADSDPSVGINIAAEEASLNGSFALALYTEYKGVATVSGGSVLLNEDGEEITIKDNAWEMVEEGCHTIDISWLNKKKATTLIVRFDTDDGTKYVAKSFAPQVTDMAVGFATNVSAAAIKSSDVEVTKSMMVGNDENGYLFFYTGKGDDAKLVTPSAVQWRKGTTGEWAGVKNELGEDALGKKLVEYKAKGATLYFRVKCGDLKTEGYDEAWHSKEAKYSYKKQANAPSVKVDPTKMTISLKKGMEYQIYGVSAEWLDVEELYGEDVKTVAIAKLQTGEATNTAIGGNVYKVTPNYKVLVRTAATDTKMASKVRMVELKPVTTAAADVGFASTNAIEVKYAVEWDETSNVLLNNTTGDIYEYIVVEADETLEDGVKWKTIKNKKSVKVSKVATSSSIYVRQAGEKKPEILLAGPDASIVADNIPTVDRVIKKAALKGNVSEAALSAGTDDVTLTITTATTGAIGKTTVEIEYELSDLLKDATAAVKVADDGIEGVKVYAPKFDDVTKKGTVKIEVKEGTYKGDETETYTFTIEGCEIKVTIKIVKATN